MPVKNRPTASGRTDGAFSSTESKNAEEPSDQSFQVDGHQDSPQDIPLDTPVNSNNSRGTLITALFLAAFGIFWIISAIRIPNLTMIGTLGPGFLPFWAGTALTIISILLCIQTLRERRHGTAHFKEEQAPKPGWRWRVFATFSALLLYIVLLPYVHFFFNTLFISSVGLALTGERLRLRLLFVAGLISGILYAIFIFWLQIPLPGSRIGV